MATANMNNVSGSANKKKKHNKPHCSAAGERFVGSFYSPELI